MTPERRSTPTWQWVTGVLMLLVLAFAGAISAIAAYAYQDTQKKIMALDREKASREMVNRMYDDLREIKELMARQNEMMTSHIIASGAGSIVSRHVGTAAR